MTGRRRETVDAGSARNFLAEKPLQFLKKSARKDFAAVQPQIFSQIWWKFCATFATPREALQCIFGQKINLKSEIYENFEETPKISSL